MTIPRRSEAGGLDPEMLMRTAELLRVLAHPQRLRLVEILEGKASGAPVNELADQLALSPSATSQHLNHMRRVGLLAALRQGREVWYRVADPRSLTILQCMRGRRAGESAGTGGLE